MTICRPLNSNSEMDIALRNDELREDILHVSVNQLIEFIHIRED